MKRKIPFALIALFAIGLAVVGCSNGSTDSPSPTGPFTPPTDWVGFTDAEMLAATFYTSDGGAGSEIEKNTDGTFEVTIKTRSDGNRSSVVYFTFAEDPGTQERRVTFRNGYYVSLTLPTSASYKPVSVDILPAETADGTNGTWPASMNTDVTGHDPATFDDEGYVVGNATFHWGTDEEVAYNFITLAIWLTWDDNVEAGEDYTFIIKDIKVKPLDTSIGDPELEAWTPPASSADVSSWEDFPVDKTAVTFYPAGGSIVDKVGGGYTVTAKTRDDGHTEITFPNSSFTFKEGYYLSMTLPTQTATSTMKPSRIYTVVGSNWNSANDIQQAFKWIEGQVDVYYAHETLANGTITLSIYWHDDVVANQDYVFTIDAFKVAAEDD